MQADLNPVSEHNYYLLKYDACVPETRPAIDRCLIVAADVLLAGIEGRQQ
ncbi:MAG: hypothetical protein JW889_12055 [Verrucomicrobia bacterium]|nr:hypothetical protein [Verrucomicrobiota bacterium]